MMVRWYTPAEAVKMATADNGDLMALSGYINPYPGKLGVVEVVGTCGSIARRWQSARGHQSGRKLRQELCRQGWQNLEGHTE
jgi:hypothetical protein